MKEKEKIENRHLGIITLIFPEVNESKEEGVPRSLFGGTIDEVGSDLGKIEEMGISHVIFGLMGPDLDRVIDTAKQLSRFTR